MRLFVLVVAALVLGLATPSARAHAPGFGVLEIAELAPGVLSLSLRGSSPELAQRVDVRAPDGCERSAPRIDVLAGGTDVSWSARCDVDRLRGPVTFAVVGLDEPGAQVLIRARLRNGLSGEHLADVVAPRLVLGAGGSSASIAAYARMGLAHVAGGVDHLLFVVALLLLVRDRRALLLTITAFTAGHSVTLALAVLDVLRLPAPPVECAIALSIVALAHEITSDSGRTLGAKTWIVAGGFGLLHGLGFAGALATNDLAREEIATALLGFNVGIELGQLALVATWLAGVAAATRVHAIARRARAGRLVAAHAIGALGCYWVLARALELGR